MALWCFLLPLQYLSRELTLKLTLSEAHSAKETPARTTWARSGEGQICDDLFVLLCNIQNHPFRLYSLIEVIERLLGDGP